MALGHRAKNIMAVISPAEYSGGPLDIDRKLRLECYRRPELHEYSEEFWPRRPRTEIFQPEPGCSDATFIGSSVDVALLSAGMLNLLADELRASQSVAIGHLLSQASSASQPTHKRFSWPSDLILEDPSSGYEVRLSAAS
jgi:hypothetical protein